MKKQKTKSIVTFGITLMAFSVIAVFGFSVFTQNISDSNVKQSKASAQEPADINNDNKVDIFDLSTLLGNWNKTGTSTSDINSDNIVNIFDLSMLLSKWGPVAVVTPTVTPTPSAIAHGEQLTSNMVGYKALGVSEAQLQPVHTTTETRISTYPGRGLPFWIPNKPYVYNNNPANHGGIVPAGGLMIDGFFVPAGVWVSQFNNYDGNLIVEGDAGGQGSAWPGIVFRGDRARFASTAPGFIGDGNGPDATNGKMWFLYCDMGGKSAADADYNEVPLKITQTPSVVYRNYISYTSTGIQVGADNSSVLENFVEKLTLFYGEAGPPGEGGVKHLNGFTTNGGMKNIRLERNKILLQSPDEAGHTIDQTDAISFFQDFADFPGTGTNDNGTVGYQVLNNYIGGGGYTLYAGMNAGKPATSVKNMVITGNKFSSLWWPNGGYYGAVTALPIWGSYGNTWSNNTWADGPRVGQLVN